MNHWIIYASATPLLYSITNFIEKFLLEKRLKNPYILTFLYGIFAFFVGAVIFVINGFQVVPMNQALALIFAGLLLTLYLIPYFKALQYDDTSRVVPLFQFATIFVLITSAFFLNETLTSKQLTGFLTILIGGLLLSIEKINGKVFKPRKSLWYMLLSSSMYGSVAVIFRFVVKDYSLWTLLPFEYLGMGLASLILLIPRSTRESLFQERKEIKASFGFIALNNGLGILAQISEAFAISIVPAVALVSIVEGGTQPIYLLILGIFLSLKFPHFIKEDIDKNIIYLKLITIALICLGLYLIYF